MVCKVLNRMGAESQRPHHSSFERDIFPIIGGRPMSEVTAPELLTALRRIEARGALDTAHRARGICGQVFRYAVATGRCERDPSSDLRGALPPVKGEALCRDDRSCEACRNPARDGWL